MIFGKLICKLLGRHNWRRQRKAERDADMVMKAAIEKNVNIEFSYAPVKICRRCGFEQAITKRKPK